LKSELNIAKTDAEVSLDIQDHFHTYIKQVEIEGKSIPAPIYDWNCQTNSLFDRAAQSFALSKASFTEPLTLLSSGYVSTVSTTTTALSGYRLETTPASRQIYDDLLASIHKPISRDETVALFKQIDNANGGTTHFADDYESGYRDAYSTVWDDAKKGAHILREIISDLLEKYALDDLVGSQPWCVRDRGRVTQKSRAIFLMIGNDTQFVPNDKSPSPIEAIANSVRDLYSKLSKAAHERDGVEIRDPIEESWIVKALIDEFDILIKKLFEFRGMKSLDLKFQERD